MYYHCWPQVLLAKIYDNFRYFRGSCLMKKPHVQNLVTLSLKVQDEELFSIIKGKKC